MELAKTTHDRSEFRLLEGAKLDSNLTVDLFEAFNRQGINYCLWKSNYDLNKAVSGEMDLDFLIERESYQPALAILNGLGFKPAWVRLGINPPGISHFYGYDSSIGRFIHVHLFNRVLTGESFLKSHLLPFEAMLLHNSRFVDHMRVASKSSELVLFIIRAYIKYGSLADLVVLAKKSQGLKKELLWLLDDGDLQASLQLLKIYCPSIDDELFLQCINAIKNDKGLIQRIGLARKVRNQIAQFRKYNLFETLNLYANLGMIQVRRLTQRGKKNKTLQTGGALIAIIGADATGKSTIVSETSQWLGKIFTLRTIHAGKPDSTLATSPINFLLHLVRSFTPKLRKQVKAQHTSKQEDGSPSRKRALPSLLFAFRAVTLAWDRRRIIQKAWRAVANGEIVISDRYPSMNIGAMDSPRLEANNDKRWYSSLLNYAARLEQRIYAQVPPPDLVIQLHVSLEIAIERNRTRKNKAYTEPDAFIKSRHLENIAWFRADVENTFKIDTGQPLEQILPEIKKIIWHSL